MSDDAAMEEFTATVIARVREARAGLARAAATSDSRAVAEALDELEQALGLAHGSEIPIPEADDDPVGPKGG